MKRDYPTFLFSNPTNTEDGVHDDKHILFILDQVEDQIELKHITNAALKWLKVQVNAGFIKF